MTLDEANALRKNGAALYQAIRQTVDSIAIQCGIRDKSRRAELWSASGLDELFYRLGSQGYKQLIAQGWNPCKKQESDDVVVPPSLKDNRSPDAARTQLLDYLKGATRNE